jgi:hypothetical protein
MSKPVGMVSIKLKSEYDLQETGVQTDKAEKAICNQLLETNVNLMRSENNLSQSIHFASKYHSNENSPHKDFYTCNGFPFAVCRTDL